MSRFRKVDAGTWGDRRFADLSPDAKLLWLYFLTGPEVTSLPGVIVAGRAHLSEVMGWDLARFDAAFGEFAPSKTYPDAMARADWSRRVVWLPKAFKHNKPSNTNVLIGWRDHWRVVPECPLKSEAFRALRLFAESLGASYLQQFDVHIEDSSRTIHETVPETTPHVRASAPSPASVPVSVSVSEGVQGGAEPESHRALAAEPEATKSPAATRTIPLPFAGEPTVPMTPDLELTSEARAAADTLGIRDIDLVWRGFCAHHIDINTPPKTMRQWVQGAWGKWIARQPGFQSRDRAREDRQRASQPPKQPTPANFTLRKIDHAALAEARRQDELDRQAAQAAQGQASAVRKVSVGA
jgi:hypothetical protein